MTSDIRLIRARFRAALSQPGIIVAPGAADGLTALLVEQAGFPAVYGSGGAYNRGRGLPDNGVTTLTELCTKVSEITEACRIPLIVDADSGFGGILNVRRTIERLDRAGASALHLQDSQSPRVSGDPLRNLLSAREQALRIEAACRARPDPNLVIIARTDAAGVTGLDDAIERCRVAKAAGADMVYVEHLTTRDDMRRVADRLEGPKLISLNKGLGECPTPDELAALGFKLLTHPADLQLAAMHAVRAALGHLKAHGTMDAFPGMIGFAERDGIIPLAEAKTVEEAYFAALHRTCQAG
jgi:2-methylisocitrate lyase-like PEP mutase family enzyme